MINKEIIGKKIIVVDSKNNSLAGIKGIVVDETKNMVFVETEKGIKKIAKEQCVFEIEGEVIDGKKLAKKHEERIKI